MFKRTLLLIFCFALFGVSSYAQMEATTTTGDGIILSSDGTWEYKIEDISKSKILNQSSNNKDVVAVSNSQNTATATAATAVTSNAVVTTVETLPEKENDIAPSYILFKNRKSCPFRVEKVGTSYLLHFDILKENQNSKKNFKHLGCVNVDSYAHLKFEDGSTLRLNSISDSNCTDGIGADISNHIDELIDKKIELIRFSFADDYTDVKLDESSQIEIPMKLASL